MVMHQKSFSLAALLFLLAAMTCAGNAHATETAGQKIERAAHASGNGIRKGAEWAGNGIRKGMVKAGEGISKGAAHAAKGIRIGAQKTGEAFAKVGNKIQDAAS